MHATQQALLRKSEMAPVHEIFGWAHTSTTMPSFTTIATALLGALAVGTSAAPAPEIVERGFSFNIPASKGSVTYKAAQSIKGTFDGGFKTYGRGVSCTGQAEGGDSDAVFILKDGATLKNAIIGMSIGR